MKNKRLITENWYRFMNEVEEESSIESLLSDMKEEDPEAFAAMQAELADYDVDPHEIKPDQLSNVFNKYAAEKETGMMTSRGSNPFNYVQKKFNKEFDLTGDGNFDLQDVLELANKSIPYGIYFGSDWTGGFEDKDISTANAQIKGLNVPALFKGLPRNRGVMSTAPYLIVYIIPAGGQERFYIFNPREAFHLDPKIKGYKTESDDWIDQAILLSSNFIPAPQLFSHYSEDLDEEIEILNKRQFAKSSIKITVKNSGVDSLLGRMMQSAAIKTEYAYATELNVKIGGSVGFKERMDELLFALDHLPMLTNVTFTLTGAFLGGQQKELQALLEEYKPFYNYEIDSAFLEEDKIMEDFAMIEKIKKARNG